MQLSESCSQSGQEKVLNHIVEILLESDHKLLVRWKLFHRISSHLEISRKRHLMMTHV